MTTKRKISACDSARTAWVNASCRVSAIDREIRLQIKLIDSVAANMRGEPITHPEYRAYCTITYPTLLIVGEPFGTEVKLRKASIALADLASKRVDLVERLKQSTETYRTVCQGCTSTDELHTRSHI